MKLSEDAVSHPTFQPKVRAYRLVLGTCIFVTVGFVAYMEAGLGRIEFGALALVLAGVVFDPLRKETAVVAQRLSAVENMIDYRSARRGGAAIKYRFVAFDGKEYSGQSLWSIRGMDPKAPVTVVDGALDPSVNLPLRGFLFYSFEESQ